MKTTPVPARAKTVNDLLKKARRKTLILEAADGAKFVLAPVAGWEGFELDESEDITRNKRLMKHLASRKSGRPKVSLEAVKAELGLS